MSKSEAWILVIVLAGLGVWGCAPRYVSQVPAVEETHPEPVAPTDLQAILHEADSHYQRGVDYFVVEGLDSAAYHLDQAIALLSQDVDWSSNDRALSERRVLLYKCRYFMERIPSVEPAIPVDLEVVQPLKPMLPGVEIIENSSVRKWIRYFTGEGRKTFLRWVHRSGQYKDLTARILREEGLPPDIVNLALIESGFNPNAYSRAHAVGMWQFISSTGRIYGLRVDWWADERRDPVRSCRAASRYLRDLYEALDSWPLALAAYNSGQRNVERAIKRARSRDYWKLRLPRETRDYVPKFMAACMIMNSPHEYGMHFTFDESVTFEEIAVEPKTSLAAIAKACGVSKSVICELNPHLIRECAPDGKSDYAVRIPHGKLEVCRAQLADMPRDDRIAKEFASPETRHTVRRGDNLSKIARRYRTTVSAIARANNLRNLHRISPGQVLLIPGGDYGPYPENPGVHVVQRGEVLSSIAHRYRVKIRDLMAWNNLRSAHVIYPGQKLIVSLDHVTGQETVKHTVTKGETIGKIASGYGVSTKAVLAANGMRSSDKIYPGQRISVPGAKVTGAKPIQPADAVDGCIVHVVKSGDTISSIAKCYGVSTNTVLRANGLSSRDRIYPGQSVRVPGTSGSQVAVSPQVHEVRKGDTISSIASRYGATVSSVLAANDLGSRDKIYPGQKVKVPATANARVASQPAVHVVKKGDTVTSIAEYYGASVAAVLGANGLGSRDKIYPGQRLEIPATSLSTGERTVTHVVKRGETITSIARKYGSTTENVLRANGLGSRDKIYPGQSIKVPVKTTG
jgi:membrane-bound lytic murein transglycosylase D